MFRAAAHALHLSFLEFLNKRSKVKSDIFYRLLGVDFQYAVSIYQTSSRHNNKVTRPFYSKYAKILSFFDEISPKMKISKIRKDVHQGRHRTHRLTSTLLKSVQRLLRSGFGRTDGRTHGRTDARTSAVL